MCVERRREWLVEIELEARRGKPDRLDLEAERKVLRRIVGCLHLAALLAVMEQERETFDLREAAATLASA